jgi:hypothetical protein
MSHVDFVSVGEYAFFGGVIATAAIGITGYQTINVCDHTTHHIDSIPM